MHRLLRRVWRVGEWDGTFLIAVYLVALAPRLALVLAAGHAPPGYDEQEYDIIAQCLAAGKGFCWYYDLPTAFRPPGYPFALAAVYAVFGRSLYIARIIQAFITAALPVLTYPVCRMAFGKRAARLSAVFLVCYVPFIFYTLGLLTENLFIPMMMIVILMLLKSEEAHPKRYAVLTGILYGVAVLVRPAFTFFLPFVLLWFYFPQRNWKSALSRFAIIAVIVAGMVTPWCIRNYRTTGQFVYLDTRTGYNLYIGYHEGADGNFNMDAAKTLANRLVEHVRSRKGRSDVVMHNWGKEQAKAFIKAHPLRVAALIPLRVIHYWNLEHNMFLVAYSWGSMGPDPLPKALLAVLLVLLIAPFAVLTLLAVVGCLFRRSFDKKVWLLLMILLYYTALHAAVFGEPRLHLPIVPIIAMLAAEGMLSIPRLRKEWRSDDRVLRRGVRRRALAALAIMAVFVGAWTFGVHYTWQQGKWQAVFAPEGHTAQLDY
jgi:4-amino-4-deoxy-L-arabinose transferase-like glycosyltransferase